MGRKGVSKRKPRKTKSLPVSNVYTSGSGSSAIKALESQPVRSLDDGNAVSSPKDGKNPAKNPKNKFKKG